MQLFSQYGLFFLETFTLVIAFLLLAGGLISMGKKHKPRLSVSSLNQSFLDVKQLMLKEVTGKKAKKAKKAKKNKTITPNRFYVIDFDGDIKASQVDALREAVTAALSIATTQDEIIIRLSSPGGSVNGYGLAASQLQRIRDKKIPLTICIDTIAASGGYLMACVASHIIAPPFAIIGSIGVVAQLPNFHRWLKKHDVDFEILTAGEYKRTLTLFGENTSKGREKFQADLEDIHQQFRDFVLSHRDALDIQKVATGEHWLGTEALKLRLIDKLQTSDDYILSQLDKSDGFHIDIHTKPSLLQKILKPAVKFLHPWA